MSFGEHEDEHSDLLEAFGREGSKRIKRRKRCGGDSGSQAGTPTGNGVMDFSKAAQSGLIAILDDF